MEALTAPGYYPFAIAALILAGLVAVELVGLVAGMSLSALFDSGLSHPGGDGAHGPLGAWMSWLNAGGVPFLVLLMTALASFTVAGLVIQAVAETVAAPLPTLAASAVALVAAVPATRTTSRWLARILPRDETTAVNKSELIGLTGKVTLGPLDAGKPGRLRVRDRHGNIHVLRARAAAGHVIAEGALALVVDGRDGLFEAIPAPDELSGQ